PPTFPQYPVTPWAQQGSIVSQGALFPYVRNAQVYICPSDPRGKEKGLSYSYNVWFGYIPEAQVQTPASSVLLIDEAQTLNDAALWHPPWDLPSFLHNGGAVLVYADGHARWLSRQQAVPGTPGPTGGPARGQLWLPYEPFTFSRCTTCL